MRLSGTSDGGSIASKIDEQVGDLFRLVHCHGVAAFVNNVYTLAPGYQLLQHLCARTVNHLRKQKSDISNYSINMKHATRV